MFDAVRVRLIEIGEAVKAISVDVLALEPDIPWTDIAAMRNHLAHRYFDTDHAITRVTIVHDLPPLAAAARRMLRPPTETTFAVSPGVSRLTTTRMSHHVVGPEIGMLGQNLVDGHPVGDTTT